MSSQVHNQSGWFSVNDACEILDVSRRTIYNWINNDRISSKTENKHRFVWVHLNGDSKDKEVSEGSYTDLHENGTGSLTDAQNDAQIVETLQEQINYFKSRCDRLEEQITEQSTRHDEQSRRHDAVVLKLTGTIENQQLMLEQANTRSFWQRLFGRT